MPHSNKCPNGCGWSVNFCNCKTDQTKATDQQVGGEHYQLPIQPIEYIHKNGLNFMEGNIVKYATRHKNKNGAEDLRKVIHYAQLLLELEYGES